MDGGGINNVPVDVLLDKGYRISSFCASMDTALIRRKAGKFSKDVNLYHVAPRRDLGGLLEFDRRGPGGYLRCWAILTENACFMVWRDVSIILMRRKASLTILIK